MEIQSGFTGKDFVIYTEEFNVRIEGTLVIPEGGKVQDYFKQKEVQSVIIVSAEYSVRKEDGSYETLYRPDYMRTAVVELSTIAGAHGYRSFDEVLETKKEFLIPVWIKVRGIIQPIEGDILLGLSAEENNRKLIFEALSRRINLQRVIVLYNPHSQYLDRLYKCEKGWTKYGPTCSPYCLIVGRDHICYSGLR
jgi:hypothetical protein